MLYCERKGSYDDKNKISKFIIFSANNDCNVFKNVDPAIEYHVRTNETTLPSRMKRERMVLHCFIQSSDTYGRGNITNFLSTPNEQEIGNMYLYIFFFFYGNGYTETAHTSVSWIRNYDNNLKRFVS